ncbi:MAG: DedA family protein, partial [Candidatus Saccharimonadales bacterium]
EKFFARFGSKAMVLAHFVPVVRTFAPVVAGVGAMHRGKFFIFDAIGDLAWAISITVLGFYVGSKIPGLNHYILLLVLAAIIISFSPVVYHLIKRRWRR